MNIEVLDEVTTEDGLLCFQRAKYNWDNDRPSIGYRFIWRDEETGNLKASKGQAIIPDAATLFELISKACRRGWLR